MNKLKKTLFTLLAFTASTAFSTSSKTSKPFFTALTTLTESSAPITGNATYNDAATERLFHAVIQDDLILAQEAIESGANPQGKVGTSFLLMAVYYNHIGIVQLLLFHKANVNIRSNNTGKTALIRACIVGNSKMVDILLNADADYSLKDYDHFTALDYAKEYATNKRSINHKRCIQLILAREASDKTAKRIPRYQQ